MQNYFNYFTEIEERFQQRRGSLLLLSTLDWALIETWREAGVPLEAVVRGIDAAFDKREKQRGRGRRINGLAWCAQAVMEEAEALRQASVGAASELVGEGNGAGFEPARIAAHLDMCAHLLQNAQLAEPVKTLAQETVERLGRLAAEALDGINRPAAGGLSMEELERTLGVMEQRMLAMLFASQTEAQLVALREQAAQEMAPYRGRMNALQIRQIEQQILQRRLLERHQVPRLSLFYMSQAGGEQ